MYFYLIFFALYNGHQACKDGVKGEDHIVELNGIDAGRVAVEVLNLEKQNCCHKQSNLKMVIFYHLNWLDPKKSDVENTV